MAYSRTSLARAATILTTSASLDRTQTVSKAAAKMKTVMIKMIKLLLVNSITFTHNQIMEAMGTLLCLIFKSQAKHQIRKTCRIDRIHKLKENTKNNKYKEMVDNIIHLVEEIL